MYLALLLLPGLAGPRHAKLFVVIYQGPVPKRHFVELREEEQDLFLHVWVWSLTH